jgi:hypothetical protein
MQAAVLHEELAQKNAFKTSEIAWKLSMCLFSARIDTCDVLATRRCHRWTHCRASDEIEWKY